MPASDVHPPFALERQPMLVDPGDEWAFVEYSVGPRGEAVVLCAHFDDVPLFYERSGGQGQPRFPLSKTSRPIPARVLVQDGPDARIIDLGEVDLAFPHVQLLPDGGVLLVGSRCRLDDDDAPERNAARYGADGRLLGIGTLGDGIRHLAVTSAGVVFAAYKDEGIYGQFGWGDHGAPDPIGRPGLVGFNLALEPVFSYTPPDGFPHITDCYALALDGETPFVAYYTGTPIVRATVPAVGYSTGHRAVTWLTVAGDVAAVMCTSEPGLTLGRLVDGQFAALDRRLLAIPDANTLGDLTVLGRDGVMYVFTGTLSWFALSLEAALDQAEGDTGR